jgi:hypothetical protein
MLRAQLAAATAALDTQRRQRTDLETALRERDADLVAQSVQSTQAVAARRALEGQLRTLEGSLATEQARAIRVQSAKKRMERETDMLRQALQASGEARVRTLLAQLDENKKPVRRCVLGGRGRGEGARAVWRVRPLSDGRAGQTEQRQAAEVDEYLDTWMAQRAALQSEVDRLRTDAAAAEVAQAKVRRQHGLRAMGAGVLG